MTLSVLADSVARRLREQGLLCCNVGISVRDSSLYTFTRQTHLENPISSSYSILKVGMNMMREGLREPFSVRSIGISVSQLCSADRTVQFDIFGSAKKEEKEKLLEETMDSLKFRFGSGCVKRACLLRDRNLTDFSPYDDHTVHPQGWFK